LVRSLGLPGLKRYEIDPVSSSFTLFISRLNCAPKRLKGTPIGLVLLCADITTRGRESNSKNKSIHKRRSWPIRQYIVAAGGRVDPSNVHVRTVGSMFLCHCGMGSEYVPVSKGKIGSIGSVRISKRSSEPVRSGTELAMAPSLTVSRIIVNLFLSLHSYGRAFDATS
jgi:hypothetical protein